MYAKATTHVLRTLTDDPSNFFPWCFCGARICLYLNGASFRNRSLNLCCSTSNTAQLLRRTVISFACKGATCCFTAIASFFILFHFSGSSCKQNLNAGRMYLKPDRRHIWSVLEAELWGKSLQLVRIKPVLNRTGFFPGSAANSKDFGFLLVLDHRWED